MVIFQVENDRRVKLCKSGSLPTVNRAMLVGYNPYKNEIVLAIRQQLPGEQLPKNRTLQNQNKINSFPGSHQGLGKRLSTVLGERAEVARSSTGFHV